MISEEQRKCIAEVETFVEEAKVQGNDFERDLKASKEIKDLWESLDFFSRHSLFTGADKLFLLHKSFVNRGKQLIEDAKRFSELSNDGRELMELTHQMF